MTCRLILSRKQIFTIYYTPCKQSFGGYIGIALFVRSSMYLVSATPPKPLIGFL